MRTNEAQPLRPFAPRFLVLTGLIAFAVAYRLVAYFKPGFVPGNFTPIAAMALFGGAFFTRKSLAFIVPLGAMALSDLIIGMSPLTPLVYALFAAMVWLGMGVLRGRTSVLRVGLAAIGSATGFYLVTNFAVWLTSGMYPMTGTGLVASYLAGLPFYQFGSLPGTLAWCGVLFGGFALLQHRFDALRPAAA